MFLEQVRRKRREIVLQMITFDYQQFYRQMGPEILQWGGGGGGSGSSKTQVLSNFYKQKPWGRGDSQTSLEPTLGRKDFTLFSYSVTGPDIGLIPNPRVSNIFSDNRTVYRGHRPIVP